MHRPGFAPATARLILCAALGAACCVAQAATFQVTATTQAGAQSMQTGGADAPAPVQNVNTSATGAGATSSNTANVGPASGSSTGLGYAAGGLLRASAQSSANATFSGSGAAVWGSVASGTSQVVAQLQDSFVLHAAGIASGTRGTLTFGVSTHGVLEGTGVVHGTSAAETKSQWLSSFSVNSTLNGGSYGSASWHGGVYQDDADTRTQPLVSDLSVDGQPSLGLHVFTIPFAFDQPINIAMQVEVYAMASAGSACSSTPLGASCTINQTLTTADFSHTVAWTGISSVALAGGQPVTQFTALSAESGFDYAVSAVPEPATASLMALGLLGLIQRGRLRKPR